MSPRSRHWGSSLSFIGTRATLGLTEPSYVCVIHRYLGSTGYIFIDKLGLLVIQTFDMLLNWGLLLSWFARVTVSKGHYCLSMRYNNGCLSRCSQKILPIISSMANSLLIFIKLYLNNMYLGLIITINIFNEDVQQLHCQLWNDNELQLWNENCYLNYLKYFD